MMINLQNNNNNKLVLTNSLAKLLIHKNKIIIFKIHQSNKVEFIILLFLNNYQMKIRIIITIKLQIIKKAKLSNQQINNYNNNNKTIIKSNKVQIFNNKIKIKSFKIQQINMMTRIIHLLILLNLKKTKL